MVNFVSLVSKRLNISNKFYYIRFAHWDNTRILRKLQLVSGQTVCLAGGGGNPQSVGPDRRQLLADNMPVGSVAV
jgi:hypothetical protein